MPRVSHMLPESALTYLASGRAHLLLTSCHGMHQSLEALSLVFAQASLLISVGPLGVAFFVLLLRCSFASQGRAKGRTLTSPE